MTVILDYSFARPDPKLLAEHCVGVMRYLGPSSNKKTLTLAEAARLRKVGLRIGVVWETVANRAAAGLSAGKSDALVAAKEAAGLGIPTTVPIFFAVDFDATVAQVRAYFQGIAAAKIAHPIGVYGSAKITEGIGGEHLAAYRWQTVAWSGGARDAAANLLQTVEKSPVAGCDVNHLQHQLPMWGDPAPAKAPAKKAPAKTPPKAVTQPAPKHPAPKPGPSSRARARALLLSKIRSQLHLKHLLHLAVLRRRRH